MTVTAHEPTNRKILKLAGAIKGQQSLELGKSLELIRHETFTLVVIDLKEVTFLDSSALGALLYYQAVFEKNGIELVLAAPNELLKNTLESCRLIEIFKITAV